MRARMFEFKNVNINYQYFNIIKNLNFFTESKLLNIYGPNNSGKTILLKAIRNFIKYDGSILINNKKKIDKFIYIGHESGFLKNFTVIETLQFWSYLYDDESDLRDNRFDLPDNRPKNLTSKDQDDEFEDQIGGKLVKESKINQSINSTQSARINKSIPINHQTIVNFNKKPTNENQTICTNQIKINNNIKKAIDYWELSSSLDKKLSDLSFGTRKKIELSKLICCNCDFWILDEPESGLDALSKLKFFDFINTNLAQNKFIIITSHEQEYDFGLDIGNFT